ncbi:uncharacterized protein LOC103723048 [Phoenix dactylifera]|uniref:Uncharacterized protein LOC103723048 n=1 Tax=Phoenix dactylifera TaxID=42345 RepID=A0A8B7D2W1_PHODC|nr:uncharacterized protein LOC103723048 [Phoenix dactylifera]
MEREGKQHNNEFKVLLGESRSATSIYSHTNLVGAFPDSVLIEDRDKKSYHSHKFTNLCNSSQAYENGGSMAIFGNLSFSKGQPDQKLQSNGKLDNKNNGYKEAPALSFEQDELNLSNDKSLILAFEKLRFNDCVISKPSMITSTKYDQTSPNHTIFLNEQYSNQPYNSLLGVSSVQPSIPPSSTSLYGPNLSGNELEGYLSFMSRDGFNKYAGKRDSQDDVELLKLNSCGWKQQLEHIPGNLMEWKKSYPLESGRMSKNPGIHAHQLFSRFRFPGADLTASANRQYYLASQNLRHVPCQQSSWSAMEDQKCHKMHDQYFYSQHLPARELEFCQIQNNTNSVMSPLSGSKEISYFEMPNPQQINQRNFHASDRRCSQLNGSVTGSGFCECYPLCGTGENCGFAHCVKQMSVDGLTCHAKVSLGHHLLENVEQGCLPENNLTKSHLVDLPRSLRSYFGTTDRSSLFAESNSWKFANGLLDYPIVLSPDNSEIVKASKSRHKNYDPKDDAFKEIYFMAKDQNDCRFLQKRLMENTAQHVEKIFVETIGHIVELMTDPSGNYLVQKLLEVCTENQRMNILYAITRDGDELIRISCNMHGTRAVQKVIETLQTKEQLSMIVASLKPGIVRLMKDINGSHVAECFLHHLSPEYNEFIFDAATAHCVELAKDRQGCCVLQKCLSHCNGEQKHRLMYAISSSSFILSQDPYGNYVVQYILDEKVPWVTDLILDQLAGKYSCLSMQKYSSNVVEKCLKVAGEEQHAKIIHELMNNPLLLQTLQDPYGNYVIQSALSGCKGVLHAALVGAIKPHVTTLRNNPYGRRVLSSAGL